MKKSRKTIRRIHLWLGLITGPIVFIVALTGAIYAFQEEIQNVTQDYRFVQEQNEAFLRPSILIDSANVANPGKHVHAVMYHTRDKAAQVIYFKDKAYYELVYLNPYSGKVLRVHDVKSSFFGWILEGHFNLWLPRTIGVPIIVVAMIIFTLLIISGLILWWPKKKKNRKQKFTIKWKARWRRKNYDLHSVLGFYTMIFALLFILTGLMWGFPWFKSLVYKTASGGEEYVSYYEPESTPPLPSQAPAIDRVWQEMNRRFPKAEWIEVHIPHDSLHTVAANANPDASTYWKTDYLYFDQQTLATQPVDHEYGRRKDAGFAKTLLRMNYDIHVGGIAGIPGKTLMCLISLIIASLPVTGFLIWYGRRKKKRNS